MFYDITEGMGYNTCQGVGPLGQAENSTMKYWWAGSGVGRPAPCTEYFIGQFVGKVTKSWGHYL